MPTYFASDVHLRLDRPDRGKRFADWVGGLALSDPLILVGDLCDFWFASRQRRLDPMACAGLRALAERSGRGGAVTVLLGNHDGWLGPFYEQTLGARVVPEPFQTEVGGVRIHARHGHRLGARAPWKGVMERRAFLHLFGGLPGPLARRLESLLDRVNEGRRAASDRRHRERFRAYANRHAHEADLFVFGHIHRSADDVSEASPRVIVLGSWLQGMSYLEVDSAGARLVTASAPAPA